MSGADRVIAPFGRRRAAVVETRRSGSYTVFSLRDSGPVPRAGQFYMLATADRWDSTGERPYLPRAFSFALARPDDNDVVLDFLLEAVGPGTERLVALEPGEELWVTGPLGKPFSPPSALGSPDAEARAALLVGGGIGVAPLAALEAELTSEGILATTLVGFRDALHAGGLELFTGEPQIATEDGHAGTRGRVTELLTPLLANAGGAAPVVYACGPPPMLEAVRALCAEREVPCELAMEQAMACGFGACFGCAVPVAGGGYIRLCVDGPVVVGSEVETALVAGSGH